MINSHIEWTDHTFNPWEGCTKVSPGCAHCYAEARNARFGGGTAPNWGKGAPRRRTSAANWNKIRKLDAKQGEKNKEAEGQPWAYVRPRVFCASLADWLDDEVPIHWLADLLELIRTTPQLDWLLLSKRPENFESRLLLADEYQSGKENHEAIAFLRRWLRGTPPASVWIGWSAEDQQRMNERTPHGLAIPAKVHFVSCEPLLGPIRLNGPFTGSQAHPLGRGIQWVICGGESGPKARPMRPGLARSLRDQCRDFSVPFFFKQWGEYAPTPGVEGCMYRAGKKAAGRLLDGKLHNAFPTS